MFDDEIEPIKCLQNSKGFLSYKIIISLIISSLQFYSILYPCIKGAYSIGQFFAFLLFKLIFLERTLSYNLIDICINIKKVWKSLKKRTPKIIFSILIILYLILFISFIVVKIILSKTVIYPEIDNAIFIENNQIWLKYDNKTVIPEGFCYTYSNNDVSLKTEDFSMMTTLPRMYDETEDGKCYLKPSMRGMFNTTMKYIFGKDYENENILIMCKKNKHNRYLIITSEKILNQTIKQRFVNKTVYLLDKQFQIENKNYFDNISNITLTLEGEQLLDIYKNCSLKKGAEKCETEWDLFTQYYWPNMHSKEYEEISGFERYQINIDDNMIIQPTFITDDGQLWSGTHYIVGGSYENSWSFGFFIETIGRKFIPDILENLLPFYSFIRGLVIEIFIRLEWFNKHLFYFEDYSTEEIETISKLFNQFNFSSQSLFLVGHSISGTVFKAMSLLSDVNGIVFEASDGETNLNYIEKSRLKKNGNSNSQITNVYSDGTIITGNDESCNVNGILPKRYMLPNVYDTACLAAISCSETMKYVPFCKQVLSQNDPLKEYNFAFDAYLQHYGFE